MMEGRFVFQPFDANQNPPAAQVSVAGTGAQAVANIPADVVAMPVDVSMRVMIDGVGPASWCYGNQAGLTLGNGVAMIGNSVEVFTLPPGISQISVFAPVSTTVRLHFGTGA